MASRDRKHVMLSYNWASGQHIVSKVYDILKAENIPVWFDVKGDMKDDVYKSMADGIENAEVVCCFMTDEYQQSENCGLELKYAKTRRKRILPSIISGPVKWKPSGWLGLITAGLNYVNFKNDSDEEIQLKTRDLINRINDQPPTSGSTTEPTYLIELVKYEYTRSRNARIERIIDPSKSYPIEKSYINLAIVTAKDQHEKEKQLREAQHSSAIISSFEEIYGMKTAIDVKDIFHTCKGQEKQVLVFGRAGIGKSTFCRYVAYQWAVGSYWSEYKLLALIPLRRLTANRYPPLPAGQSYSLIDLVKKELFQNDLSEKDDKLLKKQFDAKKTLWILDGYDEIVQNVPPHLEYLFELLLKTPHHILTSRPYMNTLSYNVKMEITGFTDQNIQEYAQQFFHLMIDELENASSTSTKLLTFLRSNQRIWGVAHIPVNLELICSLWNQEDWSETRELTVTTLYTMMTEWLCRRYLRGPDGQILQLSPDDVEQQCQKELTFLENLAFNAMKRNTIIIRSTLLKSALNETQLSLQEHPHILNIGVLKSFYKQGLGNRIEMEKDHYFVHLSFQEYFAARYLINALNGSSRSKAIDFINLAKYDQRFALCLTFASGLLTATNLERCSNTFWNTILNEPLDIVGIRHIQLIIYCIELSSDDSNLSQRSHLMDSITRWTEYAVATKYRSIRQQLTISLASNPALTRQKSTSDVLIKLLQTEDLNTTKNVCHLVSRLSITNPQRALIHSLIYLLNDRNNEVRRLACEALSSMGEKAATNEVISKLLVTALEDENKDVRMSACIALGWMGEKAATNEVISKLVTALEHENEHVRRSACIALRCMGEKAATNEVISKLVTAFEHENEHVRRSACDALGGMGEKAATNEVISKLLVAVLEDENKDVRRSACIALGRMGEKAATNEVISKLVTALEDENKDVRRSACDALGGMGEKAATNEVISKLATAFEHENEHVRRSACDALGGMGEKAATNEVISKLLVAVLEDENKDVRRSACIALGRMGEKAATNEVISKLVTALEDENKDVRRSACDALGGMGEKAATNEVISKLATALEDENEDVRSSACDALGGMGEKAATNEVISKLLVAVLEDENKNVRRNACDALESMGEKAATNEVISKLVTALEDENMVVRSSACEALWSMGEKAATNEVISKLLVTALEEENGYVRRSACCALGGMGEKAATNEVISKLVTALEDENKDVRRSACIALERMGEKAATNEVISKLATALEDENEDVRSSACDALGGMGEKAATNEVISKLLVAVLEDENKDVRRSACIALGRMGEKAATNEVISKLVTALEDENKDVRRSACIALGSMGEKAATNEVISKLVTALEDENRDGRSSACDALECMGGKAATKEVIKKLSQIVLNGKSEPGFYDGLETLQKILSFSSTITHFDSETIELLFSCLSEGLLDEVGCFRPVQWIKAFLDTKKSVWLSVATLVTILQGNAVAIEENVITVYGSSEPVKFEIQSPEIHDQLVQAFVDQRERLHLPYGQLSEGHADFPKAAGLEIPYRKLGNAQMKSEKRSSSCNLL